MKPQNLPRIKTERNIRYRPMKKLKDNDFRIGTWNVLTMLQAGKLAEITDELISYGIKIAALQEIRWKDEGELRKKHYSVFYSGSKKEGHKGTGFWVSKTARESVLGFEPINNRLCLLKLKGKFQNITLVSVYAPTEESEEEEKDNFYEDLDKTFQKVSKHDMIIILGDLNAKIGRESFVRQTAGLHSLHQETNDNGIRLCSFAHSTNMWISSVSFPHKNIHKITWKLPGTNKGNQIDHMLINRRYATSVLDVRTYRGANCDSDHFLVIAKIRQRLATANKRETKQMRWDSHKLKDNVDVLEAYQESLSEKLNISHVNQSKEEVAHHWDHIKSAINKAATETIGTMKKSTQNDWYDNECRYINGIKNDAYKKYMNKSTRQNLNDYKEKRKAAKKLIKTKKRNFLKSKISQIEEKAQHNKPREMYLLIKQQSQTFKPIVKACKSKTGLTLTTEDEILNRWREFFSDLYSADLNCSENGTYHLAENYIEPITLEEVKKAILKLKNCKASGEDAVSAELLKYGGQRLVEEIHLLLLNVWSAEIIPLDWLSSIIIPVHKKGDRTKCENYRGISLLNTIYKVFTNILYERVNPYAEEILTDYQCGFRRNKSTTDQCFVLSQIFEKHQEFQISLHCLFIDFKQAFDSLHRSKIGHVLISQGIPSKYVRLITNTLVNTTSKVRIHGKLTTPIIINSGVRQGDALSTTIFNLMLNYAIKEIDPRGNIFHKSIQICAYADDIVIIARNILDLKETFTKLVRLTENLGLKVNQLKTKYMKKTTAMASQRNQDLVVGDYIFESVENFTYLGVKFNNIRDTEEAVQDRLQAANRAFYMYAKVFRSRLISRNTKFRLYKTLIRPVLTYGCEVWKMKTKELNQIEIFERKILRRIFGSVRLGENEYRGRYNYELEELINRRNVRRFIKAQRIKWLGHVIRMPDDSTVKRVFNARPEGRRRRGRPRRRWLDAVEEDINRMGIRNYRITALDRQIWAQIAEDALAHTEL